MAQESVLSDGLRRVFRLIEKDAQPFFPRHSANDRRIFDKSEVPAPVMLRWSLPSAGAAHFGSDAVHALQDNLRPRRNSARVSFGASHICSPVECEGIRPQCTPIQCMTIGDLVLTVCDRFVRTVGEDAMRNFPSISYPD